MAKNPPLTYELPENIQRHKDEGWQAAGCLMDAVDYMLADETLAAMVASDNPSTKLTLQLLDFLGPVLRLYISYPLADPDNVMDKAIQRVHMLISDLALPRDCVQP